MEHETTRRRFLARTAAAAGIGALGGACALPGNAAQNAADGAAAVASRPVAVSSANGLRSTTRAVELILQGTDTLDAAIAGVTIVEEDPDDMSVGYGGLPNEDGVVELDACVMHGPSWKAGAVAALRGVKTPSRVAQLVLSRTDHVLLVGSGAARFARAHGFKPVDLLTEKARLKWLEWKESHSSTDDWLTPEEGRKALGSRPTGTITCLALNPRGEISGVTSTSGLAFKIPGRVGDSPLIGAGLYVDGGVGAAGATGRGEAVIVASGSRIVVENMRRGLDPKAAVLDVLHRIVEHNLDPRLRDAQGRPDFDVTLYALRRDGAHAAASIWKGARYAVSDGSTHELHDCLHLFERA